MNQKQRSLANSRSEAQKIYYQRKEIKRLQQENEKIRKMNMHEHKYGSDMEEKYLIEKTKNDRAVEYIMSELVDEWSIKNDGNVHGSDLPVSAITPLLNILRGEYK